MSDKPQETSAFDAEEWVLLWQVNPEGAENRRQQEMEQLIMSAPEEMRQKLRQLQWRIDMERARHDNPMGRCVALYTMLMNDLWSDNGLFATPKLFTEVRGKLENMADLIRGISALAGSKPDSQPTSTQLPYLTSEIVPPRSCVRQALSLPSSGA